MLDFFENLLINRSRYKTHSEAVIVSCFFNPENSPYRLIAFQKFYKSIKHLNHVIVECLIGPAKPQLPDSPNIIRVRSDTLLWHKESLLNYAIANLPARFRYVFWIDADVKFTNNSWLPEAVEVLKTKNIVQPFEYCFHLAQDSTEPDAYDISLKSDVDDSLMLNRKIWRSFCANYVTTSYADSENYNQHGHVGFAWGARRDVLDEIPLYDRALIGGADHIMAHAAAGHLHHECIRKSFTDDIENVERWMANFYDVVQGKIGYVPGDLYHYWHGDTANRQYLKRIQDFTGLTRDIKVKDANGLYVSDNVVTRDYLKKYFRARAVGPNFFNNIPHGYYSEFAETMGYNLIDIIEDLLILNMMMSDEQEEIQEEVFEEQNLVEPEVFS